MKEVLLTAHEAAARLGVEPTTIRTWVSRGYLNAGRRYKGTYVWTLSALRAAKRQDYEPSGRTTPWATPSKATCQCGGDVHIGSNAEWATLTCAGCGTSMAVMNGPFVRPAAATGMGLEADEDNEAALRRIAVWKMARNVVGQPHVYFIRVGEFVKIGTSTNIPKRVGSLCVSVENVLGIEPGGREREQQVHKQFAGSCSFKEWFHFDEPLIAYIRQLQIASLNQAIEMGAASRVDELERLAQHGQH